MARVHACVLGTVMAVVVWAALAGAARADEALPDINFWGAFAQATAQCQRAIGMAVERCFDAALRVEQQCSNAQIGGQPCDSSSQAATLSGLAQVAGAAVAQACTAPALQQLQFATLADAQSAVARACGDQATAAQSVLYGPAVATGFAASGQPAGSCMQQTAQLGAKFLHVALRVERRALDRMAVRNLTASQKQTLLAQATAQISALQNQVTSRLAQMCPGFSTVYGRDAASLLEMLKPRSDCVLSGGYVQSGITCPAPVCGNGITEAGEQCDDGNTVDDDLCHNNCTRNNCAVYPSTYGLIQAAIFDSHSCSNDACHGSSKQEGLDLRAGASYASIVGVPAAEAPAFNRIEAGDESRSFLYFKLAAATQNTTQVYGHALIGAPMPSGLPALSANELEAVRLWIHADAPQTGIVAGVANLLNACALPADPIEIAPPPAPTPGTGVQIHMPRWPLAAHSEHEVCFASYYDLTEQVPAQFRSRDGSSFRFHSQSIEQDPQSHHLIVNLYHGTHSIDDPIWGGPFTCKGGPSDGQPCEPTQLGACGAGGVCGSPPIPSVACIGYPPGDPESQFNFSGFTGTQQTSYAQTFAPGVYEEVPLKGIIIWNSHAFNLTDKDAMQEAWLNFDFAQAQDQQFPVQGIFDISDIFGMNVPPFTKQTICNTHVLDQGAHLFQLSSHMHQRGKLFQIFAPDGTPLYSSTVYNDPVQLNFDPPMIFSGSDPVSRTLQYCATYDNGATDPSTVKRKSTSPPTPNGVPFGGPCFTATGCVAGAHVGDPHFNCNGVNARCDSSPGAGDGVCDACTLTGGVTTEDEMFILLGDYYVQ